MKQFNRGVEAAKSEIYRQLNEMGNNMDGPVSVDTFKSVVRAVKDVPVRVESPRVTEMGKAGIYIVGYFNRDQMREIGSIVDRMKELGFRHIELECTGNGETGFIFEECQLHINNGPKAR